MTEKKGILTNIELFCSLTEEQRSILETYFVTETVPEKLYLFKQGKRRKAVYLILSGEIELKDESLGAEKTFAIIGPGTILGEPLLIEDGLYGLSGFTISDCNLAILERQMIQRVKKEQPEIYTELVLAVAKLLAHRLSVSNRGDRGIMRDFTVVETRKENDLLGEKNVPKNVLWGVQTLRAIENFNISGVSLQMFPEMIESLAIIKESCAIVNHKNKQISPEVYQAIFKACNEIRKGMWHSHFPVDMIQGGAGTTTNMNMNEVIANRALNILGHRRGDYDLIDPELHVNMSQSTADVYPTAIKMTLLVMCKDLLKEIALLTTSFEIKAEEFSHIIKMGRTQLQDAVPMTLGQEFKAWSGMIESGGKRISVALNNLRSVNIGGTFIGTGVSAPPGFSEMVLEELNNITGLNLKKTDDFVEETQDTSSLVELSGVFKMIVIRLSKICNDLRLLSSGPRCGFNEINLPPMQAGQSFTFGKVNPVIPEVVNQVAFQVIGLDNAVSMASEAGQLERNVFEPLIAFNLFTAIKMMKNAMRSLRLKCIEGITANEEVCQKMVQGSIGIVNALKPVLGPEKTSEITRDALKSGLSVYELVQKKGLIKKEELDSLLTIFTYLKFIK